MIILLLSLLSLSSFAANVPVTLAREPAIVRDSLSVGTSSSAASSAILDVISTTKAFYPPRVTTAQKNAISSPTEGAVVWDTDTNAINLYDGSSWDELTVGLGGSTASEPTLLENVGISATVAANALTISLKQADGSSNLSTGTAAARVGFRGTTESVGAYTIQSISSAVSLVVDGGSTLGTMSNVLIYLYVYLVNDSSVYRICVSSALFDENNLQNATDEGTTGASDSATVLYCNATVTGKPMRLIGKIRAVEVTAGAWATAPDTVASNYARRPPAYAEYHYEGSEGFGSTATVIREFTGATASSDTFGILTVANDATNGFTVTANTLVRCGVYYSDGFATVRAFGISKNSAQLTTAIDSITAANRVALVLNPVATLANSVHWSGVLAPGDVIRPHTDGGTDATDLYTKIYVSCFAL